MARKLVVTCRHCVRCTGNGFTVGARNITRGTVALSTAGISEAVIAFMARCPRCKHQISLHRKLTSEDVEWEAAERLAAQVLRGRGYKDVAVTASGSDGGFDVVGSGIVVQVKYRTRPTGRPELQQLVGANRQSATMAFFSRSGYSMQAIDFADSAKIALFEIELPKKVTPVNTLASKLRGGRVWGNSKR